MMRYKGYSGVAEIAYDTDMIYGRVVGLRDVVTFQGRSVAEASRAFRDSVDDYLELCASRGETPEKPFSGRFLIRISQGLHRTLVEEAARRGVSLNGLIASTLAEAFPAADTSRESPGPGSKSGRAKVAPGRGKPASAKKTETEGVPASG